MTYSHMANATLPLARSGFTSEFGKGSGGSHSLWSPDKLVEFAKTSANAMERLGKEKFQIVVSDIRRNGKNTEGLDFMAQMRAAGLNMPLIYYVSELDKAKGVPVGAFGITDDPNELIHLTLDVVERIS